MPEFFRSVVFELTVLGTLAAMLTLWGYLTKTWPLSTALLYGLVVFTCLVFLRDRFWQPSDQVRVRQWLETSGFSLQNLSNVDQQSNFRFVLTDSEGVIVNIYQPRNARLVYMEVQLTLPPVPIIGETTFRVRLV